MKLNGSLADGRIVIRNYKKSDLDFLTEMWFDEENGKYMSDPTREYVTDTYQSILDDLENSDDGYYLVVEMKDGALPSVRPAFSRRKTVYTTLATAFIKANGSKALARKSLRFCWNG